MSDEPGGLIGGRYRLGELLGSGGSASVFEATDARTGDVLAVKVLHPHLSASPAHRQRFVAEARAAMAVRGRNVVEIVGAGTQGAGDARLAWIAMELAPGLSLAELVERDGPLPVGSALAVAEGVLAALEVAHAEGIMHRDISPGNVVVQVGADGEVTPGDVRLVDFGIAAASGAEHHGEIQGNAAYVSPEQAAGGETDVRGDLYQVGGVLCFALTGRPPFSRESVEALLEAHRTSPPPVPSVSRPGLPRAVDRLVVRAMVKHPDGRFASAAGMREAVRNAAAEFTRAAARTGSLETPATTEPTRAIAGGTVVLGAAARAGGTKRAPRAGRAPRNRSAPRPGAGRRVAPLLVAALVTTAWLLAAAAPAPDAPTESSSLPPSAAPVAGGTVASPRSPVARVPEIGGASLAEARSALSAAGLVVGGLVIQDSAAAGDTVLEVSPAPGAALAFGSAVDLVVASGANGVPSVAGLTEAEAGAAVQAAGFTVRTRVQQEGGLPGTAVGTEPGQRTVLRLGEEVVLLVIARAAEEPGEPGEPGEPSVSPTPTPTGAPSTTG